MTQYRCQNQGRRREVAQAAPALLNGIDYLEVSADQRTLTFFFIHNLPGQANPVPPTAPALTLQNVTISGGVRIQTIQIESIAVANNVLTVQVNPPGDFSTYTLRLVQTTGSLLPPVGFDTQLAGVPFSFKVECPSDFDCRVVPECPPEVLPEPEIDYLAKDYASFRQLMLDRVSVLMPHWRERNPADLQIALVELLAYVGDRLSYYQDAVATEAYLATAHQRPSVRRHARLLDYAMQDGCNARAWICFEVEGSAMILLSSGKQLLTGASMTSPIVSATQLSTVLRDHPEVFETLYEVQLRSSHNRIEFYTWSDTNCCLPKGATQATLWNAPSLSLAVGDVVVFEEIRSPTTGSAADANPTHRHAVRLTQAIATTDPLNSRPILEIAWDDMDALPFPLCLSATRSDGSLLSNVSVVRGNVVLVDHGYKVQEALPPVSDRAPYRPTLQFAPLTQQGRVFFDAISREWVPVDRTAPAQAAMRWELANVHPDITLQQSGQTWKARRDLLRSDRFAQDFIVEMTSDGTAILRFGDDVFGQAPRPGDRFTATYRIGNGTAGNVGAGAIARIVSNETGIKRVWNPLPATGGTDPESLDQVKAFAPYAFRTQERAVTETDWAEVSQRQPQVQRAMGTLRWTGSWYTAFVTVDRTAGRSVDDPFETELRRRLERYRIAGYDLEVNAPVFVPLDLQLTVCVKLSYLRSAVKQALLRVFSDRTLPDGRQGFFHPDRLTFGHPLYTSQLYQVGMAVDGVESLEITRFHRWGKVANQELERGMLSTGRLEIARLDNDPNFPENGKLDIILYGGL